MIIQFILVLGLLFALLYAFVQRRKSRMVSLAISATSVAGIYFVLFPSHTTAVAQALGVGRGADLVMYCWIVISLVISMNLRFRMGELHGQITELARELAIRAPNGAAARGDDELSSRSTLGAAAPNASTPTPPEPTPPFAKASSSMSVRATSVPDWLAALLVGLAVTAWVLLRNTAISGPLIWDEGVYVQQSRFGTDFGLRYPGAAFGSPAMPNLLFLQLYGLAFEFPARFMEVARAMNALCFGIGAAAMYAVGRRVLSPAPAAAWAVLGAGGAIASFAAMFTPESMYFLGFWGALWLLLRSLPHSLRRAMVHAGLALGLMMLVKPHALMLLTALVVFALLVPGFVDPSLRRRDGLVAAAAGVIAFLVAWTLGTAALTGSWTWPGVGGHYAALPGTQMSIAELGRQLPLMLYSLSGHTAVLLVVLGVTLPALLWQAASVIAGPRSETYRAGRALALLAAVLLVVMLAVIVKYSAGMTQFGASESIDRLHGRYYNFLLPLLPLAFFAHWHQAAPQARWARALFAGLSTAAVAVAALWIAGRFAPPVNDFPEAYLLGKGGVLPVVAVLSALAALATLWRGRAATTAVATVLVLVSVAASVSAWRDQLRWGPLPERFAAEALQRADPNGDRSRWQVFVGQVDHRMPWLAIALAGPVRIDVGTPGQALDCRMIAERTSHVLALDGITPDCGLEPLTAPEGFTLWRRPAPR